MNGILTMSEVASELRCSKAHLSHIVNGKVADLPPLPVVRIGRRVLIRRAALVNWLWIVEGVVGQFQILTPWQQGVISADPDNP